MMVGYALLGVQPLAVRALAGAVPTPQVVAVRFGFALVAISIVCLWCRRGLTTRQPAVLFLRGLLGGMAVLAYFGSVQLVGAGRGTVLNYTYPVWANLFALVFLGQGTSRWFWPLLTSALAGVALVALPPGAGWTGFETGDLLGLASAVFAGGAVLCIKLLRRTDDALTVIASFSAVGLLFAVPLALFPQLWPVPRPVAHSLGTLTTWALLVSVGMLAFGGHVMFTRGYRHTSVQLGTVLSLSVPVIASALGIILFDEPLTGRFALGALLVVTSSALLACIRVT